MISVMNISIGSVRVINSRMAGLSPCPLLDKESSRSIASTELAAGFLGSFGRNGYPGVDGGQCQKSAIAKGVLTEAVPNRLGIG